MCFAPSCRSVQPTLPEALFPVLWLSFPMCQTELQDHGVGSFLSGPKRGASHGWGGAWRRDTRHISECPQCSYVPDMWHVNWPVLLQLCRDHEVMQDECYCQVVKQITNNTSTKQ